MPKLPQTYNPSEHDPQGDNYEPIPKGVYEIEVVDSDIPTSKGGDPMVELVVEIVGNEDTGTKYAGRKIWEKFNLYNTTGNDPEKVRQIARGQFSAACRCLGVFHEVNDTEELHGRRGYARVGHDKWTGRDGDERIDSVIKAWKFNDNAAASAGPVSSGGSEPWNNPAPAKPGPSESKPATPPKTKADDSKPATPPPVPDDSAPASNVSGPAWLD